MTSAVAYELRSGVAWITLSAPESGNALNDCMIGAIADCVGRGESDALCRVIVIRSSAPEFCKGLDFDCVLSETLDLRDVGRTLANCLSRISHCNKPVIACVEGNATGGGVGLASACDLVISLEGATFTLPEAIIGMIPAVITPFLLRRMPAGRVQYLTLSSRSLTALEAREFGLVDEVACGGMEAALGGQLRRLFCSSPRALAEIKRYFERLNGDELGRQTQIACDQLESWLIQPDVISGVRDFAEGFSPPWFAKYSQNEERANAGQNQD
jgi:methylglutaconyl-CoA hydratase/polyketide biosynthesis enoyl-CoA hydratase PksH